MQYAGIRAHTVKHEPLALHLLEQTIKLGLQCRFTRLGGCESVNNRLKIKTADQVAFNSHERQGIETFISSGAGTNLKVGASVRSESGGTDPAKIFFGRAPPHFVSKSTISRFGGLLVMVSTVWSVSCLLFSYSRCPPLPSHL